MSDNATNVKLRAQASLNGQEQPEECTMQHSDTRAFVVPAFTQIRDLAEYIEGLEARIAALEPKGA